MICLSYEELLDLIYDYENQSVGESISEFLKGRGYDKETDADEYMSKLFDGTAPGNSY